ncbi:MAG: bis(5'-nucleosyl)-tetraphosphatase (symmetrical) YqeK [Fusobacteriaceae bacterium]
MNEEMLEKIKLELKNMLSEKRYNHSISVMKTAVKIAEKYEVDEEKIKIAALLHDVLKECKLEMLKEMCEDSNFKELSGTSEDDAIIHGFAGAVYVEKFFKVKDIEILNSIKYHTIGRRNMSLLEKIIYLADAVEPNRDYPGVKKIREILEKDIDLAIIYEIDKKIEYLIEKRKIIHLNTIDTRNWLLKKKE